MPAQTQPIRCILGRDRVGASTMGRAGATGRACLAALCGLAAVPVAAAPRAGPAECRAIAARADALASVGARGELVLASGARAVLGSLRWPDAPETEKAAADWLAAQRGRPLTVVARGEVDRWGRARIDATVDEATDLAGALIAAGLAQVDAGEGDTLCRPALLGVEETARKNGLGLWRSPPLDAADGPALRAADGRFAVVQGRLRHVGERSSKTYLDFAARGEDGLTVTVSKRTWRRMREHGLSADRLRGRMVRVRGIVEIRRGPTIDVGSPEIIEILDEPPVAAGVDRERAPRR